MTHSRLSVLSVPRAIVVLLVSSFVALSCFAQQASSQSDVSKMVRLRKVAWQKMNTPDYSVSANERTSQLKQWVRIEVQYDTAPDWLDEIELRYYIMVQNPKKTTDDKVLMFTRNVVYVDVAKGSHTATLFLRPNTVARHGDVERGTVEVYIKGQLAGTLSAKTGEGEWWKTPSAQANSRIGYLWTRPETPFAFVAYDMFEQLRQR